MASDKQLPKYFNLLSAEDQKQYLELQSYLSSKECRNNRGRRLTKFSEILNSIHQFCIKNDENDVLRCMVCGVCWLPPKGIAINIRQLHVLLDKCKSSINGSLQRMGYNPLPPKNDLVNKLIEFIPNLKNNFSELREWTIRTLTILTPQPEPASINSQFSFQNSTQATNAQNNTCIPSSVSMNSFSDVQNNVNRNFYSSFSSPQPSVYMNQFMMPQEPASNQFNTQQISNQFVSQPISNQFVPQQTPNQTNFDDGQNTDPINTGFDDSNLDYFNDPFCLPPSSLFDEDNGFGYHSEFPFD